jgi:hypothetical protein
MQSAKLGYLAMRRGMWYRKPLGGVGQVDGLLQIEFGVITQPGRFVGGWITRAQNRKFSSAKRRSALTGAIGDSDVELRCVVIENYQDERWLWFGAWFEIFRKTTPDDFAGGGLWPPYPSCGLSVKQARAYRALAALRYTFFDLVDLRGC